MLEIEAKYAVPDFEPVLAQLHRRSATWVDERSDEDHYFNAPDRDFGQTDEAFRIRRIGNRNYLTYKGPKRDAETKTRTEIEIAFAEGPEATQDMARLVMALKYRPTAIVKKKRVIYHLPHPQFEIEVCLDEVESVGKFVEVEIIADEAVFADAKPELLRTATELGLTQSERRSYLEMLLLVQAGQKA